MADSDHHHHHHHHHRPNRLSLPSRTPSTTTATTFITPRPNYPDFPYNPTPSKTRRSTTPLITHRSPTGGSRSSISFLFLLLLSLRSLYSLFPFLRSSSQSFSLFPFTFLISFLSFLLSLSFSIFSSLSSSSSSSIAYRDPFKGSRKQNPVLQINTITPSQQKILALKSVLLALVFLLRFQALRYCGTAAMILAELSGTVAARFFIENGDLGRSRLTKVRGFIPLFAGLLLLSISWDRVECAPFSAVNFGKWECVRIWPMLLPFLSGFVGCYEGGMMNKGTIKQLGQKRVRLICLMYATVMLFVPAVVSFLVFRGEGDGGEAVGNLVLPLANMVVFGVLLSENYSEEKTAVGGLRNMQKEFLVTFVCLVVLELFYFPNLSLWGLLVCGFLLWMAVGELDKNFLTYVEIGVETSESLVASTLKAIRHILSERKSRKIALFLLINTSYMVVEFVVGFMCNSLGLISDACHMLFDCAALAIGLYASYISRFPANHQFNYGRGRFEVLSGYANAVFLVLVGALIVLESIERILDPQEISTNSLLTVSVGGLVVNMIGLVFFHDEHHHAHGGSGPCSHSHHQETHSHQKNHSHLLKGQSASLDAHEHVADNPKHAHQHSPHSCKHDDPSSDTGRELRSKSLMTNDHQHDHCDHEHHHAHHQHSPHSCKHDDPSSDTGGELRSKSLMTHDHQNGHCDHDHHQHDNQHHHDHNHDHEHRHQHQHIHTSACSHIEVVEENSDHHSAHNQLAGEPPKKHNHHHHIDHNMEGIFLHVLADTMGSVGVVVSTLLIKYKGWLIADPASSIFISILIVSSVIPLLRNSAEILLQRVPRAHETEIKEALENIVKIKEVRGIQNMHVWTFSNSEVVGTLHLHVSAEVDRVSVKAQVSELMHDAGVQDLTLQVECLNQS